MDRFKISALALVLFLSCSKEDSDTITENIEGNRIIFANKEFPLDWGYFYLYETGTLSGSEEPYYDFFLEFSSSSMLLNTTTGDISGQGPLVQIEPLISSNQKLEGNYDSVGDKDIDNGDIIGNNVFYAYFSENAIFEYDMEVEWEETYIKESSLSIKKLGEQFEVILVGEDERGIPFDLYYKGKLIEGEL